MTALRRALQQRLPDAIIDVRPLSAQVNATMVEERTMATLAAAFGLLAHVLGGASRLVLVGIAVGIAVGIPAAWATSRWVASMLFELKPADPAVVAGAAALLLTTAHLAAYLPARRAARVDPLAALRQD